MEETKQRGMELAASAAAGVSAGVADGMKRMRAAYAAMFDAAAAREAAHGDWQPYEESAAPLRCWFKARWIMLWPLQFRVVPWWRFTYGELIITLLAIAGVVGAAAGSAGDVEGTGGVATVPLAIAFATINHNSLWTFLIGIPFERALTYHKLAAYVSVLVGAYHGYEAVLDEGWNWGSSEWWTGAVLWIAMALLILTSLGPIRRKLFEVFLYLHVLCFAVTIVMALSHGAGAAAAAAALFYGVDFVYRYVFLAMLKHPHEVEILRLPGNVVRMRFPKGNFSYKAGQYLFVCIPSVSALEWHPFSLSSAPFERDVMVHIRVLGGWTRRLHAMADKAGGPIKVKAYIDGCYGEPGVDVEGPRYQNFLLVSGGIGITPMQSIANEVLHQYARGRPLNKLWFVWSVRGGDMAESLFGTDVKEGGAELAKRLPAHFSPDLLIAHRSSLKLTPSSLPEHATGVPATAGHAYPAEDAPHEPLHCDFHLTRVKTLDGITNLANIKPEIQECLRFGRPDMEKVFQRFHAIAKASNKGRVAVLSCGPDCMLNPVKRLCWKYSKDGVGFDFHGETFAF